MPCLPLDIDITHVLAGGNRSLIQQDITGVPDHNTKDILLWLSGGDVDGSRDVGVLGEDVHPHVEGTLRE